MGYGRASLGWNCRSWHHSYAISFTFDTRGTVACFAHLRIKVMWSTASIVFACPLLYILWGNFLINEKVLSCIYGQLPFQALWGGVSGKRGCRRAQSLGVYIRIWWNYSMCSTYWRWPTYWQWTTYCRFARTHSILHQITDVFLEFSFMPCASIYDFTLIFFESWNDPGGRE